MHRQRCNYTRCRAVFNFGDFFLIHIKHLEGQWSISHNNYNNNNNDNDDDDGDDDDGDDDDNDNDDELL